MRYGKLITTIGFPTDYTVPLLGSFAANVSIKEEIAKRLRNKLLFLTNNIDLAQTNEDYVFFLPFKVPSSIPFRFENDRNILNYSFYPFKELYGGFYRYVLLNNLLLPVNRNIDSIMTIPVHTILKDPQNFITKKVWNVDFNHILPLIRLNSLSYNVVFRIEIPKGEFEDEFIHYNIPMYILYDCNCMDYHFSGKRRLATEKGLSLLTTNLRSIKRKNTVPFCKHIGLIGSILNRNKKQFFELFKSFITNTNTI